MEKGRLYYRGFGPLTHPRAFLSEVILPPRCRDVKGRFYDSWSDSCLGPGLRRVLHQLWDHGTPRVEHDHGGPHDYFCDILCTVSGLDNEFNKLEHFLSTRKRSNTRVSDGKTSTISPNDISYLDFAANSFLELIVCLKHELKVHGKIGRAESFGTVNQTNKLISVLENKLYDLLRKLNKIKIDGDRNICCKRCSEHMNQWNRPNCPWKNNVGNPYGEDRCVKNVCLDYLPDNDDPIPSCRAPKTSKHGNVQGRHLKPIVVKNKHYKLFTDNDTNVRSDSGPWIKPGHIKSKASKNLHNTFMGAYGRVNNSMVQKRYPNSMSRLKQKSLSNVPNKNYESNHNFTQFEVRNYLVHASSKPAANLQHNTCRRKRAGNDGSAIYDLSDCKPVVLSYNNNRHFHRKTYIKGKHKQQHGHNKISQSTVPKKKWSKRVSFNSTPSDQTTSTGNEVSDSYIVMEAGIKSAKNNSKQNPNHSSKNRLSNIGKDYSYTNRNQRRKRSQKDPKTNADKLKKSIDSFSSQENISNEHNYIESNGKTKSYRSRKNKRGFQINKPNVPLKKANNKPLQKRRKRSNENEANNQKNKNLRVYSSRSRSNRKNRARSSKSKVGNFVTGVRNKFSKMRLFSSKPPTDVSESGSSKSSISSKTYYSNKNHKVYKEAPKRQKIEFPNSRYPSRNRVWSRTNRHEDSSTDSGASSSVTQLSRNEDHRISLSDERNSGSYPYFFERIPSSYDYDSDRRISEIEEQTVEESCDVCPKKTLPQDEDCELADEFEITFEKVKPKKFVRKIPREETTEESTSTITSESSTSSVSVSVSLPEYKFVPKPRRHFRRKKFRNVTIIRNKSLPAQEELPRSKHRRHRKYIRVGSQKFEESTENVVDYDSYQPAETIQFSPPTVKDTLSRGTSTENIQPAVEKFTFYPPVKDTYSRGTSTEIAPLYAKKTSTSDLIKLIQAIGTNTERVITRDTGIDPIPLKQKTLPVIIDVKSKSTNTEKINVRSTGIGALPANVRPPIVNKGTDPLFYLVQKDKTTNTAPEKKKHITNIGTDPRPIQKLQQATKAINTEPAVKIHVQTETPKRPKNVSIGTTTTPVNVQDQKTSYEKVKTTSRGNNPSRVKTFDVGFQFDTIENKPVVKTVFTETFNQPRVGKTTQTSIIETPKEQPTAEITRKVEPGIEVQTQTEKVQRKPPPPKLKQRNPSESEEIAIVEAEDPSSPSELSMHLVFEKFQEEIYKRRTKVCKPRCSDFCDRAQTVVVCDNIRSRQMTLNSLSDCNVSSITQKNESPHSDFKRTPQASKFTSNYDLKSVGKVQGPGRTRKPKLLSLECGIIGLTNPLHIQNRPPLQDLPAEPDEKNKGIAEKHYQRPGIIESSNTTLTSCDWKNIAEKVKLNQ